MNDRLPPSWRACTLGEVVDFGATDKAEPSEIPANAWVLELEDIERDSSKIIQRETFAERKSKSTKNRFHAGDVLYGKLRPYLNKVVRADTDGFCTTEIVPLRGNDRVSSGYLFWWLKHPVFLNYVAAVSHGLNMPRLGTEAGRAAPFVLAPKSEQKRIVAKLEVLQSRSRRAREALDAVPPLLEKLRQSILAAAFRGDLTKEWRKKHPDVEPASELLKRIRIERRKKWEEAELAKIKAKGKVPTDNRWTTKYLEPESVDCTALPKLPKGWCWAAFDELAFDSLYGPRFGAEQYSPRGLPMLRTTDLDDEGNVVWNSPPRIEVSDEAFVAVGLRPSDLVVTRTGATIGKCALYRAGDEPALPSAYLIRFGLITSAVSPEYVLQAFLSPSIQSKLRSGSTATAQPNVNARTISRLPFPVAPVAEQAHVLERLAAVLAKFGEVRTARDASAMLLETLNRATLAKAFRGELVSQDPGDEPAETMLVRTHANGTNTNRDNIAPKKKMPALPGTRGARPEET